MARPYSDTDERILIVAPVGQDALSMATLLAGSGIQAEVCATAVELCTQIKHGTGGLLLTEEALELPHIPDMLDILKNQPPWSELPLIVLTSGSQSQRVRLLDLAASAAGSMILLERPISKVTLVRSVEVALRSRRRQYQVRDLITEIRLLNEHLEQRVGERTADLLLANEKLQKGELQLVTAQHIAHLGSWEWDLATQEVTWSEELFRIHGLHHEEFGRTLESFLSRVHPEDRDATRGLLRETVRTQGSFDCEWRLIRPDGTIRYVRSQGMVVKNENGQAARLLGVCLDITDRKAAGRRFQDLLESAPDAVVIVNSEGRVILVNAQTEILFGYKRTELLGQHLEVLLPRWFEQGYAGRRLSSFFDPHPRSIREGLNLSGMRKDRSEFPVAINLSPIETEDGILVSISIRDMTLQNKMQEELLDIERKRFSEMRRYARYAQHAREEERLRIARELHDGICQTLSGMKLRAEGIEEEAASIDKSISTKLHSFNKRYEEVISEVRRMSTNLRPSSLDDFGFAVAVNLLAREFKTTNKVHLTTAIDESVKLDPQKEIALYRITQESLANIAQHAEATNVTISLARNGKEIVLRIADNGKGFDPTRGTRKDPYHGFGLVGMRDRAEALGGNVSIESAVGQGTTITIALPLNGAEEKEQSGVRNQKAKGGKS